nr:phage tail domain-containing protein [Sinosporangium album]
MRGLHAPTYTHVYTETPGLDGAHLAQTRVSPREVFIPVFIEGGTRAEAVARRRTLVSALNPAGVNTGRLTVNETGQEGRYIDLVYMDGAEGDEGQDAAGNYWCNYGLRFLALDPFFYSSTAVTHLFRSDAAGRTPFFSMPFLGLHLNRDLAFNGNIIVSTVGEVDTWPVWVLDGPLSGVTFKSVTLNREFTFTYQLGAGQRVTIDTRPGRKSVIGPLGVNLWEHIGSNPQFWAIGPSENQIQLAVAGMTADTLITLEYRPRYLGA